MMIYLTERLSHNGECRLRHGPLQTNNGKPLPDRPCLRISDEELDYWAEIYTRNNLHGYGILFSVFIEAPLEILEGLRQREAARFAELREAEPPLPAQARVQRRLDLQSGIGLLEEELESDPRVTYRNGAYVEPLHHHTWPRRPYRRAAQ